MRKAVVEILPDQHLPEAVMAPAMTKNRKLGPEEARGIAISVRAVIPMV
jgi:hypothetical protein